MYLFWLSLWVRCSIWTEVTLSYASSGPYVCVRPLAGFMYVSSTYKLFISSKPSLCQTQQWNVSTYSCSFYMLFRDLAEVTHVMCFLSTLCRGKGHVLGRSMLQHFRYGHRGWPVTYDLRHTLVLPMAGDCAAGA